LYMATADAEIVALRRRTGAEIWRQKALLRRGLSNVVVMDDSLVTADFQGYVHFLDKTTGALEARVRSGKVRVRNAPVVSGNTVVVMNDRGQITAYRVSPIGGARPAPAADKKTIPEQTPTTPDEKK